MDNDPRYKLVEAYLPATLPAITRQEAERAAKRLFRAFGGVEHGSPNMTGPARLRYAVRRVWISPKPTTGHFKGWGRLIHDVSHDIFSKRHPSARAHDNGHHVLERELAMYVVARDWLQGGLRTVREKPTLDVKRAQKLEQVRAGIARWTTKQKRANTALKKLRAKERRLTRLTTTEAQS
jgi:hypothetical protein